MNKRTEINQTSLLLISTLLKQGKNIDITAVFIVLFTLLCYLLLCYQGALLLGLVTLLLVVSVILWLIQKYYAIRVSIDRQLFDYFAQHFSSIAQRTIELDDCLVELKLKKRVGDSWVCRKQGAMALLKKQLVFFVGQLLLLVIMLVLLAVGW